MSKFFKVNVSTIIQRSDKILMVKRSEDEERFPGLWGIPGGTVEMSDKSLESALEREVLEEVGIAIKNHKIIQNNVKPQEMYGVIFLVYTSEYDSGTPAAIDGAERVEWMSTQQIMDLECTPGTKEIIAEIYDKNVA